MTSAISSVGSSYQSYASRSSSAPDPSKMIQDLFKKMDSNGDSTVDSSELTSFLKNVQSGSQTSGTQTGSTQSVDTQTLLSAFDTDGDGKITKQEFTDSANSLLSKLREQMTSHHGRPPQVSESGSGSQQTGDTQQADGQMLSVFLAALGQYQSTQSGSDTGTSTSSQLSVAA